MEYHTFLWTKNKICFSFQGNEEQYVSPQTRYSITSEDKKICSYGFLTEENSEKEKRLQLPELNSGFLPLYWLSGQKITEICGDEKGCYVQWNAVTSETLFHSKDGVGTGMLPLTFVTDVPEEGNYRVKVKVYAPHPGEMFLFLGCRNLAARRVMEEHEVWEGTFTTNICAIIPRNQSDVMENRTLDVTLAGDGMHLMSLEIEPAEGKTIYIAGDSTVTNQSADYPYQPGCSYCGWGQMLPYFLPENIAVSNHSHSGLTTESFRSEGHYQILRERIHTGDLCLIQFGHNDQKLSNLKANEGYRNNLIQYIREIRQKNAVPVLVTPLARNSWRGDTGEYNDLLEDYEQTCKEVGLEFDVPVVDLHGKSMEKILNLGCEEAKNYFFPSDYTHSNDYGAYLFAGYVYQELKELGVLGENQDPAMQQTKSMESEQNEAEKPEEWVPLGKEKILQPPGHLADIPNPAEEKLWETVSYPEENITRVEGLEMVIATMHFFPTNVYNDAFEDIVGHETYAGTVECALQNGLIPKEMMQEQKFYPKKWMTRKEFFTVLMLGYRSRKTWEAGDSFYLEREEELVTRGEAAELCKKFHI